MTHRTLLKASRQVAVGKPRRGRPPAIEFSYEAALLVGQQAMVSALVANSIPGLDNEEIPSLSDIRTWEVQAPALGVSPWQAQQAATKALEGGPSFLPTGYNFVASPLTRTGLLYLLRAGVFTPEDLCREIGINESLAGTLAEECQIDSNLQAAMAPWSAARDRLIASIAKETKQCVSWPERIAMDARARKKRPPLPPMPWLAAAGALRRLCSTRQAYRAIGELSLTEGTKEQARQRLVHRWSALRDYVNAVTRSFVKKYGSLGLASILAEPSMVELHGAMRYGPETSLRMMRMEVVFSRNGLLDTIIDSQIYGEPDQHPFPIQLDGEDGIPPEVEDGFLPLLLIPACLLHDGKPVDGEHLLQSEKNGGLPWPIRHRLLIASLWEGFSPWTW